MLWSFFLEMKIKLQLILGKSIQKKFNHRGTEDTESNRNQSIYNIILNNIVIACLLHSFNLAVHLQFFIDIFNMFSNGTRRKE